MTDSKKKSITFDNDELLALAKLDISKGNNESALTKIKTVLASKTPEVEAYAMAAKIYAQLKLYSRAQEMFKAYLQDKPDALVEQFQFGMTYFDAGHRKDALDIWTKILDQSPTNPPALFYKALACGQEGDKTTAKKCLEILLKSVPTDNLYFNQAKQLLNTIERGEQTQPSSSIDKNNEANNSSFLLKNAYGTEH